MLVIHESRVLAVRTHRGKVNKKRLDETGWGLTRAS